MLKTMKEINGMSVMNAIQDFIGMTLSYSVKHVQLKTVIFVNQFMNVIHVLKDITLNMEMKLASLLTNIALLNLRITKMKLFVKQRSSIVMNAQMTHTLTWKHTNASHAQ